MVFGEGERITSLMSVYFGVFGELEKCRGASRSLRHMCYMKGRATLSRFATETALLRLRLPASRVFERPDRDCETRLMTRKAGRRPSEASAFPTRLAVSALRFSPSSTSMIGAGLMPSTFFRSRGWRRALFFRHAHYIRYHFYLFAPNSISVLQRRLRPQMEQGNRRHKSQLTNGKRAA